MHFNTKKNYIDRESKATYVYDKYGDILAGDVLDVGSDNCYLRDLIGDRGHYTGVGLGGTPDIEIDLEKQTLPFEDNSFDCVVCLDVLEHIDNTHKVFTELCRVSRNHVIISLPNSYRDFIGMLFGKAEDKTVNFKYYGLPTERPDDRHKWFFSNSDADSFIRTNAQKNNMDIVQIDSEGSEKAVNFKQLIKRALLHFVGIFTCVNATDLYYKTHWSVLKKQQP